MGGGRRYLYISTTCLNILGSTVSHVNAAFVCSSHVYADDWACFIVLVCSKFCWTLSFHLGNGRHKMYASGTMYQRERKKKNQKKKSTSAQTCSTVKYAATVQDQCVLVINPNILKCMHPPEQHCFNNYHEMELCFSAQTQWTPT